MSRYCWNCGNPGSGGAHYCSHCSGYHHFITYKQLDKVQRDYGDRRDHYGQLPEPPLGRKPVAADFRDNDPEIEPPTETGHDSKRSEIEICNVVPDKMTKHYDYAVGATIDSRSQKRRVYAENDMIMVSAAEEAKKNGAPTIKCKARSYPGQKNRRSSAEKWTGARTKTGQEMI